MYVYRRRIGQLTPGISDTMGSCYNVPCIHNSSAAEMSSLTILNRHLSGEFTQIGWCSVNDTRQKLRGSIGIISRQWQVWQFWIMLLCYRRRRHHCKRILASISLTYSVFFWKLKITYPVEVTEISMSMWLSWTYLRY